MKKFALLCAISTLLALPSLSAQYSADSKLSQPSVLEEHPFAKADLIAAADNSIEARIDPVSGQKYFVRSTISPWSEEVTFQLVIFDPILEDFIPLQFYAQNGDEREDCCKTPRDSCRQKTQLNPSTKNTTKPKPRKTSTVKIIADDF